MASADPVQRLRGLLDYLKSYHDGDCQQCFPIELTRQQIADLTGLRVETVVRTVKMVNKEIIKLRDAEYYTDNFHLFRSLII